MICMRIRGHGKVDLQLVSQLQLLVSETLFADVSICRKSDSVVGLFVEEERLHKDSLDF